MQFFLSVLWTDTINILGKIYEEKVAVGWRKKLFGDNRRDRILDLFSPTSSRDISLLSATVELSSSDSVFFFTFLFSFGEKCVFRM